MRHGSVAHPTKKRLGSHEIHRRRVDLVRSAGPHTQRYLGRLREGPWVFGDQVARLAKLVEHVGARESLRACAALRHARRRRAHQEYLGRGLQELELLPLGAGAHDGRDFGRELREYDLALSICKSAS